MTATTDDRIALLEHRVDELEHQVEVLLRGCVRTRDTEPPPAPPEPVTSPLPTHPETPSSLEHMRFDED